MSYNGKILADARTKLEKIKSDNKSEQERRISEVYKKIPEIESIDREMRSQMIELAKKVMTGSNSDLDMLRTFNKSLQARRLDLLRENGYPADYLDEIISCSKCRDTGVYKSGVCSCLDSLYKAELTEQLSTLLRDNGEEVFDNFRISLYPEAERKHMENIYNLCREFSDYFPGVNSLVFTGGPGLGKTFLSACIAREISKKGFSVVYDSASAFLGAYDKHPYSREYEAADVKMKAAESCDLMILDDLGTEYTSSAVMSALYTLINSRLLNDKPTIINTNLSEDQIRKRYSPAIVSRLDGCFTTLTFTGNDIRKILKEEDA